MTFKAELPDGSRRKRLVFFHCASGTDRTGTAALSYKVAKQGMTLPEAVASMNAAKESHTALPNRMWQRALLRWCYATYRTTSGVCATPPAATGWAISAPPDEEPVEVPP